jgi:hypothetical protein
VLLSVLEPTSITRFFIVIFCIVAAMFGILILLKTFIIDYSVMSLLFIPLFFLAIFLICALILVAGVSLTYVATAILYILEFTMRRIAEYPKGPTIAIGVIFSSVFAFIKSFSG